MFPATLEPHDYPRQAYRWREAIDRFIAQNFFAPFETLMAIDKPSMAVDIDESDNAYILRASLPGVKPENLQVEVRGETVLIRGFIGDEQTQGQTSGAQGVTSQFATNQGAMNQGPANQGRTNQGPTSQGTMSQGTMSQGTMSQGATGQGATNQGATNRSALGQNQVLMHERYQGAFQRMITLPMPVDASRAEATFENGVLTLVLPKKMQTDAQRIPIKTKA